MDRRSATLEGLRTKTYLLVLAAAAFAGCSSSDDGPPEPEPIVGPARLRRLSNTQYLNALQDLFPAQAPALPPLPKDASSSGFENSSEAQQPSDVRIARYEAIANLYAEGAIRASVRPK